MWKVSGTCCGRDLQVGQPQCVSLVGEGGQGVQGEVRHGQGSVGGHQGSPGI